MENQNNQMMKPVKKKKYLYLLLFGFILASCQKEEGNNSDGRFDAIPFKWDYVFNSTDDDYLFIGDQFLSVENRLAITPPNLYVGAVYGEKDFGSSFSPEITDARNPIDVIFNFTKPFTGTINKEHGSVGYHTLFSEALNSKPYKEYMANRHSPYEIKLTEIYTNKDILKAFPNNIALSELLYEEAEKDFKKKGKRSRMIGELCSKSFTVYMDFPVNGFFKEKENLPERNPVYIHSLTYGKTACFVVESDYPYGETEEAILSKLSRYNMTDKTKDIINSLDIILFTASDNSQTAKVFKTVQDLEDFIDSPFSEDSYGYPVYCQGNYTKDNTAFYLNSSKRSDNGSHRTTGE